MHGDAARGQGGSALKQINRVCVMKRLSTAAARVVELLAADASNFALQPQLLQQIHKESGALAELERGTSKEL